MNHSIIDAIESDNLDLFRLLYKEHIDSDITIECKKYYLSKIGIYLLVVGDLNYLSRKKLDDIYHESQKYIVTKDLIDELDKILKLCIIKNSNSIFNHIINTILSEYNTFCKYKHKYGSHIKFKYSDICIDDMKLYLSKYIKDNKIKKPINTIDTLNIIYKTQTEESSKEFIKQQLYLIDNIIKKGKKFYWNYHMHGGHCIDGE